MQYILMNVCEKFHYDLLRNDKALENRKSDNNKNPNYLNKNNVRSHGRPVSGSKKSSSLLCEVVKTMHSGLVRASQHPPAESVSNGERSRTTDTARPVRPMNY